MSGMTDFHTHILPGMDDGSRSPEESASLLRTLAAQGVTQVVATPHFYAGENSPERFLRRREAAWQRLQPLLEPDMPRVILGAEVCYFEGIGHLEELSRLCIEGARTLLLEMPFAAWSHRVLGDLLELADREELQVVLAHIERYMPHQSKAVWHQVLDSGVWMQANADYFLDFRTRHTALRLLREGQIQLLGSDCHGLTHRPPHMDQAVRRIGAKPFGAQVLAQMERTAIHLLEQNET